jgi:hypothetical protein
VNTEGKSYITRIWVTRSARAALNLTDTIRSQRTYLRHTGHSTGHELVPEGEGLGGGFARHGGFEVGKKWRGEGKKRKGEKGEEKCEEVRRRPEATLGRFRIRAALDRAGKATEAQSIIAVLTVGDSRWCRPIINRGPENPATISNCGKVPEFPTLCCSPPSGTRGGFGSCLTFKRLHILLVSAFVNLDIIHLNSAIVIITSSRSSQA